MFSSTVIKRSILKYIMSGGSKRKFDRMKVAILGSPGCGKTAFTVRFLTRRFIGDYERNTENTYRQDVDIDGQKINMEILDTKINVQEFPNADGSLEWIVKWADAFIILYDVTDARSSQAVSHIKASIDRLRTPKTAPVILVGNKMDMVQSRAVTYAEGRDLARLLRVPFFEISVRESYEDVAGIFSALYVEHRAMSASKSGVFKGLRERRKRGRFAILTRQRSVSM